MSQQQSKFPYLTVGISILLGCLFLVFFFLAVSNQPDYMPSQQKQNIQSTSTFINMSTLQKQFYLEVFLQADQL
jgi:hypothetical protein